MIKKAIKWNSDNIIKKGVMCKTVRYNFPISIFYSCTLHTIILTHLEACSITLQTNSCVLTFAA